MVLSVIDLLGLVFAWAVAVLLGTAAGLLWWARGKRWVRRAWAWGWGVGLALGILGFVGPIVVAPEANQGPLLGIFLTGPLGFAATTTVLLVAGALRERRRRDASAA
jgi:hypothetical protein